MGAQQTFTIEIAERTESKPVLTGRGKAIVAYLKANGTITLAQATELTGRNIYANARKHVGVSLAALVRRGVIVRRKPGVFALPDKTAGMHE